MTGAARWGVAALAGLAAFALAAPARAGRSHFGWLRATEVVPERTVELETWILEENGVGDDQTVDDTPDETAIWWTTVVGITDQIELGVPIELRHLQAADTDGQTFLYGFGAEVRWRLVSPDPVEAGPVAPALRLGLHRLVNQRSRTRGDAGLTVGFDLGPRIHAAADVGATWIVGDGESIFELTPAAGVSVLVAGDLRAGVEAYAEAAFGGTEADWIAAGPNVAWTYGRFWLTAALPFGLTGIGTAPRINWAVAF
jgi:hypothetical protein